MKNILTSAMLYFLIFNGMEVHGQLYIAEQTTLYMGNNSVLVSSSPVEISSDGSGGLLHNASGHLILENTVLNSQNLQLDVNSSFTLQESASLTLANQNVESIASLELKDQAQILLDPGDALEITGMLTNNSLNNTAVFLQADQTGYSQLKFLSFSGAGVVKQQQYFSGDGWHNFTSPFDNIQASQFGLVGSDKDPNVQNMYSWDASLGQWTNIPNGTENLDLGEGYAVYYGANGAFDVGVQSSPGPYILELSGVPSSTASFNTNYTANPVWNQFTDPLQQEGWNLIGNPFNCALDFKELMLQSTSSSTINDAFYTWDLNQGSYIAYSPAGIEDHNIAPLQGFWVQQKSGLGSGPQTHNWDLSTSAFVSSSAPTFYKTQHGFERLILETKAIADSTSLDYTLLAFINGATDGFDPNWDAHKIFNHPNKPSIFSEHQGQVLANNAIDYGPGYLYRKTINIGYKTADHGNQFEISLNLDYLQNFYEVHLEDLLKQKMHDLNSGAYVFSHDTSMVQRFLLHIGLAGMSDGDQIVSESTDELEIWQEAIGRKVYIKANLAGSYQFRLLDLSGKLHWHHAPDLNSGQQSELLLPSQLCNSFYILEVTSSGSGFRFSRRVWVN